MNLPASARNYPQSRINELIHELGALRPGLRAMGDQVEVERLDRAISALLPGSIHGTHPKAKSSVGELRNLGMSRETEGKSGVTHVVTSLAWVRALDSDDDVSVALVPVAVSN